LTTTSTQTAATLTPGTMALIAVAIVAVVLILAFLLRRRSSRTGEQRVIDTPPASQVPPMAPVDDPVILPPVTEVAPVAPAPPPLAPAEPLLTPAARTSEDDLTRMKGVGPKLAAQLVTLGYTRFAQIAALTPDQAEALDAQLGSFRGRLHRDRWIEQAGYLANGDTAGFEAAFGRL
jgi:predicted flap endonuclease-1-like 5' DNA nuclease